MDDRGLILRWPDPSFPEDVLATLTGPGGPFEWAVADVLGSPTQVFVNRPRTLVELLRRAAEQFGDRPYVVFPERTLSFAGMLGPVASVAAALRDRYGVGKGDRVAVVAANCIEYAITFWAATSLGALTVAMNGWWTGPEMVYAIELTRPNVLFGDTRRLARLEGHDLGALPVVDFAEGFAELEAHAPAAALPDVAMDEDDPFLILFTSGTTGRPKGAVISHRSNIHFMLAQSLRAGAEMLRNAREGIEPRPMPDRPCIINASPYFHISGLNCQLVMCTSSGMTIVYPPPGRWDEVTHLELTEKNRATFWSLVPTQLWRVLAVLEERQYDLSSLVTVGGGSAVWPPELLRKVGELIPGARPGMGLGYGSTETNGLGTSLGSRATYDHAESVGQASATMEVCIRDPLTRETLGAGEVGEICLRSAAVFLGYWEDPGATAKALDADRWYHTGDFGLIRDGFVYLEGRRQDLIIRGGENLSPIEIENRLIEHPEIDEVAVVGIDHPVLGQEVAAFVVLRTPGALTEDEIRAFAAETLAAFKVPSTVVIRDSLPHNASGKVLKHVLTKPDAGSGFIEE